MFRKRQRLDERLAKLRFGYLGRGLARHGLRRRLVPRLFGRCPAIRQQAVPVDVRDVLRGAVVASRLAHLAEFPPVVASAAVVVALERHRA